MQFTCWTCRSHKHGICNSILGSGQKGMTARGWYQKYGWEKNKSNVCAVFVVQPGGVGVSTCIVTERISFSRQGVLESVWVCQLLGNPEASFQRSVELWLLASRKEIGVPFSQELHIPILHNSDKRWIPALVVHGDSEAAPSCTARLNWLSSRPRHVWEASAGTCNRSDQVSDCELHASRARLTTWLLTMCAWRCVSKRLFASREQTLLNVTMVESVCTLELLCASVALMSHLAPDLTVDIEWLHTLRHGVSFWIWNPHISVIPCGPSQSQSASFATLLFERCPWSHWSKW